MSLLHAPCHCTEVKCCCLNTMTAWLHGCAFYRLWGDHGQEALENAHVCLINATATGTEILKNLVLPGKDFKSSYDLLLLGMMTLVSFSFSPSLIICAFSLFPGIGAFTIVDGHKVSGEDVGNKYDEAFFFKSVFCVCLLYDCAA